ncbi:MAG: HAD family phosphatase [Ruminococcus sp.]|nr:HAD family phosphatase [Ruminococcus sp.]
MNSKKTLYLSDLDGTLLRRDETVSAYTASVINSLPARGVCFSYATARSRTTALKATRGITVPLPLVVYNGAFVCRSDDGGLLYKHAFSAEAAREILRCFRGCGLSPVVYSLQGGEEKFSYLRDEIGPRTRAFLDTRAGDPRDTPLTAPDRLLAGEVFYFNCIGGERELLSCYEALRERHECLYYNDPATGDCWLELMPAGTSKAAAALALKKLLGAERLVVFGDSVNDLSLFEAADEAYAVANASEEVKARATAVIASNEEDAVAHWLEENVPLFGL